MFKNKSILAVFSEKGLCSHHVIFRAVFIPAESEEHKVRFPQAQASDSYKNPKTK